MEFVYNVLLFLHFIGLALIIGAFVVQVRNPEKGVTRFMLDGALTQLITGVLMVGIAEMKLVDEELNMTKIAVKLIIVLIITVLAFVGVKKPFPQTKLWAAIGILALLNVAIAVFWG